MAKKVKAVVKIQIQGGKANPAPPVGTALGPHGINLMQFCKEYNAKTSNMVGQVVPVEVTVFARQQLQLYPQDPSGDGSAQESSRHQERFLGAKSRESRVSDQGTAARDRRDQNEGPQCAGYGCSDEDHRRHGPEAWGSRSSINLFTKRGRTAVTPFASTTRSNHAQTRT